MVDGIQRTIITGTVGTRVGSPTVEHEFFRVRRRNGQGRGDPDTAGRDTGPYKRAGGAAAYGQTARTGRQEDAQVVLSRSAAILVDGNLESDGGDPRLGGVPARCFENTVRRSDRGVSERRIRMGAPSPRALHDICRQAR